MELLQISFSTLLVYFYLVLRNVDEVLNGKLALSRVLVARLGTDLARLAFV